MPRSVKGTARVLAVFALVLMMQPLVSLLSARAPGRDYPRCIHACNDIRRACTDRCQTDCEALFPNDPYLQLACVDACKDICISESQDCKNVCQAIKNGSPTEP